MKPDYFTEDKYPVPNLGHPFELNDTHGCFLYETGRPDRFISMIGDTSEPFKAHVMFRQKGIFPMGRSSMFIYERQYIVSSTGENYGDFDSDMTFIICAVNDGEVTCVNEHQGDPRKYGLLFQLPEALKVTDLSFYQNLRLLNEEEILEVARYNKALLRVDEVRILGVKEVDSYGWY